MEIAATATPPVCRIMNSGKFFYQQAKREAEARKHQKHIQVKEVKFRPKIDEHDFQFKKRNAERFLLDGNKVKSTVIFRGREMVHNEIGRRILNRLAVGADRGGADRGPAAAGGHDDGADPRRPRRRPRQGASRKRRARATKAAKAAARRRRRSRPGAEEAARPAVAGGRGEARTEHEKAEEKGS